MSKTSPILYSPAMVRALIDGFKTQTRRLATSPLAKAEIGDVLYVRECFRAPKFLDHVAPRNFSSEIPLYFEADVYDKDFRQSLGRLRPAMHMPQIFSRVCLTVTDKRFERVKEITTDDAKAEGLRPISKDGETFQYGIPDFDGYPGTDNIGWAWAEWNEDPRQAFAYLWDTLHGNNKGEAWANNPEIVALTFTAHFENFAQRKAA